ncbi:hypothetical protein [Mycobacterium sp. D16R24]|uniref:hypothetical protein n=1 Tax=Mycobacterium sp. D16R24 TaxID=1855656 RepID=UPI00257050B0|nr:hypothetical protein [Mycobacterium sp. D16R24]
MRNDIRRNIFRAMTSGALILTGCSQSGSGTPTAEHPTTYSCQAQAATGEVYTQARNPKEPFTVSIPKLPGWEPAATARTDNKLAVVKSIGISRSLTMLIPLDPAPSREQALARLDSLNEIDPSVTIIHHETVEICGSTATRLIGTTGERGRQYDYLNLAYQVDDNFYPIQLRNQMSLGDVPLFSADIDVMFQGFQISS